MPSKDKNQQLLKINVYDSNSIEKTIIVDVRTPEEWNEDGHANCSVNFPLDELSNHLDSLKNFQKVVLVCRSGNRAGLAKNMLESEGLQNIENLGSWTNIKCP
jgi:rhodanese-related sulfurtransferase